MNSAGATLLLLALACFIAGVLAVPFVFQGGIEVPRYYRILIVLLPLTLSGFLGVLAVRISDHELPGAAFWTLLTIPLALFLHYCT